MDPPPRVTNCAVVEEDSLYSLCTTGNMARGAKLPPHKISANEREGPDQRQRVDSNTACSLKCSPRNVFPFEHDSVQDDIIIIIKGHGHDDIHIATFRAGLYYLAPAVVTCLCRHSCQLPSPY